MLISYSVENYRSIKDKAVLTMEKRPAIKGAEDNVFHPAVPKAGELLKTAVIYGYNSSGKSNFLRSAHDMRGLILFGHKLTHGEPLPFVPFLLDYESAQKPTRYEIKFIHESTVYQYEFAVNPERVTYERLIAYPKGSKQTWFERRYQEEAGEYEWAFSPKFKGEVASIKNRTLANALFFSKAAHENHELIKPLTEFFRYRFYASPNASDLDRYTEAALDTDAGKRKVRSLLIELGLGMDGLSVEKREITDDEIPSFFSEEIKQQIRKDRPQDYEIRTIHKIPGTDKVIYFDLDDQESEGTRKVFSLAGILIRTLERGGTLIIDELEKNLHCKLLYFIIELFNKPRWNPLNAQLIFSTHTPTILDTNEFRRDQIWFADKADDKGTLLYNLLDVPKHLPMYKPIRKQHSVAKAILEGRFYKPPALDGRQLNLFDNRE